MDLNEWTRLANPGYLRVTYEVCTWYIGVGAPQSTSQDRSQVIESSKSVRIRVWETIPVGDTLQLQNIGNGDVGEMVFQYIISGNIHDLIKSESREVTARYRWCAYLSIELEPGAVE